MCSAKTNGGQRGAYQRQPSTEVQGFMNITGSNLHARCFGGSRRLYVVFQRIRAYFVRKLSGAHVSSVARAKPRAEAKKRQAPSTSRNLFFVASSFGLLRHTKARRKASHAHRMRPRTETVSSVAGPNAAMFGRLSRRRRHSTHLAASALMRSEQSACIRRGPMAW
jgi:hypothetical protein